MGSQDNKIDEQYIHKIEEQINEMHKDNIESIIPYKQKIVIYKKEE